GRYQGKQIIKSEWLRFEPTRANPGFGMSAWLNRPGGRGPGAGGRESNATATGGWVYPNGMPELYMAGGAGGNRLYVIPSKNMVIVRLGETQRFVDGVFFRLLFEGGEVPKIGTSSGKKRRGAL
ncbi:MAG: hypothetical protein L0Y32_00890, partial [Nevskiales bacterium]|nr:hypothetical protein [Nevskiales bacterium]